MKEVRFFQTIRFRLIIIYVLLILIAVQIIGVYFVRTVEGYFVSNFSDSLNKQAYLLAEYAEPYLASLSEVQGGQQPYEALQEVVSNLNTISTAEIQIINASGIVLTTTSVNNQSLLTGQKNTQTVVTRALQGVKNSTGTMVDANGKAHRVIATPVGSDGKVLGAIYMIAPMDVMYETINGINRILFSGTIFALALTAILGIILAHTISNPIKAITNQVTAIANGNYSRKVKVYAQDEIGQLSEAFNHMTTRLQEALSMNEEEKEKLESVLTNMSDGVVATDSEGSIIVINARAREILQVNEIEITAIEIDRLLKMRMEQIRDYAKSDARSELIQLETGEETKWVRATFSSIHLRGQEETGAIIVLQDVTEQEKLDSSRREFVENVSHELRTPLTTIKSYLEALNDGALEDEQLAKRFIGVTQNETERMIRLVNDLLHLSKIDSIKSRLQMEYSDLLEMLEDVSDRFSFQAMQKSIDLKVEAVNKVEPILLDPDQIDQVLDNLVSNAIKYTPDGGKITIRIRKVRSNEVEVAVIDTGIGIPRKDLERIFERFYRVDKARSRSMGGTGLGLSIAREIIRAHGGQITIESEANVGTSVTFTLPILKQEGERA